MATTMARRSSELLQLYLSLSPASKAIAKKTSVVEHHHRARVDDGGGAFRCRTCGRSFATFQALGGHRTSHKRPRVRADGLDLLLGARPGKATGAADVHRCNTCGVVFATGQALGGHMRRHRAALLLFGDDDAVQAPETTRMFALMEEGDDRPNTTLTLFI
ncbi:hypothetical protein HU200_034754 [Digitaria exilis]|uniref:C2H2-type domain-containing protein n=1 Tax=Digitaria exilis TaxID=1010633 RepID=A0A835BIX1_9POAL|nr:hypothetical protein HU200_034754 [Digitaria exilis]